MEHTQHDIDIAILKEKIKSAEKSLEIQAKEYERRLEILNHEAERLKSMQATYIRREMYDREHKYLEDKITSVTKVIWIAVGLFLAVEIYLKFFSN